MISVCMATYNGEKYIKQQLLSILSQLSDSDEVVVSDDCSKDGTLAVIESINDARVKVFSNTGCHGVVPNFENALNHANGDILFLADQDDEWMEGKVEKCCNTLENCDFVSHNAMIADGELKPSGISLFEWRKTKYGFFNNLYKMGYQGCCMAFKRHCLTDALPFPKGILWHDMWLAAVFHLNYKGVLINEPLLMYRRHGGNASPTAESSGWSFIYRLSYRWTLLVNVLIRKLMKH